MSMLLGQAMELSEECAELYICTRSFKVSLLNITTTMHFTILADLFEKYQCLSLKKSAILTAGSTLRNSRECLEPPGS
jgi:hypothetical protein